MENWQQLAGKHSATFRDRNWQKQVENLLEMEA
jgi:hypothetical protein